MLVGHFAPALALRAGSDRAPLWALVLATQAVDVLFFALVLLGAESAAVHPDAHPRLVVTSGVWSHSLIMTATYVAICVAVGAALRRPREGALIGAALGSHWLADLVVHVPDLPITLEQASAVGLGLWRLPLAATALEVAIVLGAALWLHHRYGPSRARTRLWIFAGALVVLQLASDLVVPAPASDAELAPLAWLVYALATGGAAWVEAKRGSSAAAPA